MTGKSTHWLISFLLVGSILSSTAPPLRVDAQGSAPGRIAFNSDRDGNWEIYVVNADGTGLTRLTYDAADDYTPTWSPDGQKIAFASDREGDFDIYVMNADGSGVVRLTNDPTDEWEYSWSPDSTRIAYITEDNFRLCVVNIDGSGRLCPMNDTIGRFDWVGAPAWSPDGTRIAFDVEQAPDEDIYAMSPDGATIWDLSQNGGAEDDRAPIWSPDGTHIAFWSERGGPPRIYVMNADGSGQTPLTQGEAEAGGPSWSPDSTRLAFLLNRNGGSDIFAVQSDGSGQVRLTDNSADDFSPTWSPDGRQIGFVSNRDGNYEIYMMDADGQNQTRLTNHPAKDMRIDWTPVAGERALEAPVILTPEDQTRVVSCVVDVSGTAEPGTELSLLNVSHDPELDAEGGLLTAPEAIRVLQVGEDGTWAEQAVALRSGARNYLVARSTRPSGESRVSSPVNVSCLGPQVVFYTPSEGGDPVATDLSDGNEISFRFDVPVHTPSVNRLTVWLVSDSLRVVTGELTQREAEGDEQPTFVFVPRTYLRPGTEYTVLLTGGIRAAPPDEAVRLKAFAWRFRTKGARREQVIEAIEDVVKAANYKIDYDVWTTAHIYATTDDIQDDLAVADPLRFLLSMTELIAEAVTDIPSAARRIVEFPAHSEQVLIDVFSMSLFLYNFAETGSLGSDLLLEPPPGQILDQADMEIVEGAMTIMWLQREFPQSFPDPFIKSELEIALMGTDRPTPIHVPLKGNILPRRTVEYVHGAGAVKRSIHDRAQEVISQLPNPLPPDFDGEGIVSELDNLARQIKRSSSWPTSIEYVAYLINQDGEGSLEAELQELGLIAGQGQAYDHLMEALERRLRAEIKVTISEAVGTGWSLAMTAAGMKTGWADEFDALAQWGLLAEIHALEIKMPSDPRDSIGQAPPSALALLPIELSRTYQVVNESLAAVAYEAHQTAAAAPEGILSFLAPEAAYAASAPGTPELAVSELVLADATIEQGASIGQGRGDCLVTNRSDAPWQVEAVLSLEPWVLTGEYASRFGWGGSQEPVVIDPGATARLALSYQAWGPGLTDQAALRATIELVATPPGGGWPRRIGPWVDRVRAGTAEQLARASSADILPLLAGELAVAEVVSTTFTLPDDRATTFLLTHSAPVSLALSIASEKGHIVDYDGIGGEPVVDWPGAVFEAGSGYQRIALEPSASEIVTITVCGMVSRVGYGERYELMAIHPGEQPALVAAFPAHVYLQGSTRELPFEISVSEIGGQNQVTDLETASTPFIAADGKSVGVEMASTLSASELNAGEQIIVEGIVHVQTALDAGTYHGALQLRGVDGSNGQSLQVDIPITLDWQAAPAAEKTTQPTAVAEEPSATSTTVIEPISAQPEETGSTPEVSGVEEAPARSWVPWVIGGGALVTLLTLLGILAVRRRG